MFGKKKEKQEKEHKEGRAYTPLTVFRELRKVQWPSPKELTKSSLLVIVFTLLFGVYFFICEMVATGFISKIVGM